MAEVFQELMKVNIACLYKLSILDNESYKSKDIFMMHNKMAIFLIDKNSSNKVFPGINQHCIDLCFIKVKYFYRSMVKVKKSN